MKKRNKVVKRILASVLSIALVLTLLPAVASKADDAVANALEIVTGGSTTDNESGGTDTDANSDANAGIATASTPSAQATSTDTSYISMPITIRDYAADGMLFEFNQVGATGLGGAVTTTFTIYAINGSNKNVANGIHVYTHGNYGWEYSSVWNLCIICDASGNIVKVIPNGTSKGDVSANTGVYYDNMKSGYYSVWVNANVDGYSALNSINDSNKGDYTLTYSGTTLTLKTAGSATYHQGDTAGFSLLSTTTKDYINNMQASDPPTKDDPDPVIDTDLGIANTTLIQNGYWGLDTDPDAVTTILNSGAKQSVYGAYIRTDLVQPELVNGEMVYTEAAVNYLASYMQQIMQVKRQNSDGSYNTYYVMGHELSELGGTDLATKIRAQVTGGLGTYAEAKAKFDAGNLSDYTQITTYYDAAYFLLHNVFNDNTGYGKTVNNYKNLNLVQTTNADEETCYVFNSGYDDAVYDYTNGVIYNSQTDTVTIAKTNSGTTSYVRGNALPDARFDPLGLSGAGTALGYGLSGDTYGDLVSASTADWADYYDTTNYNMSLEGHAQFIYYEDDDLYFTFTGDDDVYLYINGVRVLDVGAAHSISKVSISLNDVAELCGLKDGQAYDFDFFYMERHGTAANFGIETNIKIVDPAMTTTKTGYQNGVNTGYNGYVDPLVPVVYEFGLQNNGEADITNLTFTDGDIGVTLSEESITLNSETTIEELSAIVYNNDGSVKTNITTGNLTEDTLKTLLASGLGVGEKIVIYGFEYTIPTAKWTDGNGVFPNTVYTTAISIGDNNSTQTLNGIADWKVREREYNISGYHVYEWVGKSVSLTKDELLQPLVDGVSGFNKEYATIVVSSASGATSGTNVNTKAVLNNDDGSITYTGTTTGADTFYYKVTEGSVEVIIGVAVYSYDVVDNTYVLDYGLPVELNGADSGFTTNDTLYLSENTNTTVSSVTGISDATRAYGVFEYNADEDGTVSLTYTPNAIINDTDSVNVNVQVIEEGAETLTKFTGVAMAEQIITAPASVVYYEDTFEGIVYVDDEGNQWVTYDTTESEGNMQSADQESNYGADPNYDADQQGTLTPNVESGLTEKEAATVEEVIESVGGIAGDASNGSITVTKVNTTKEILHFTFEGTGFEIISRTTADDYAVLSVCVTDTKGTEAIDDDEIVKQFPVITECKSGDLYQVPVISVTNLPASEYHVSLKAAASTSTVTRLVYIDGIRIYGALEDKTLEITAEDETTSKVDKTDVYYSADEKDAEFYEVKELIKNGKAVYADAAYDEDDNSILISGTTMIEAYDNSEAGFVLTQIYDIDEYLTCGPNNELYIASDCYSVIGFYLIPNEEITEEERTLQIGAHRKADTSTESTGAVELVYASTADEINDETAASYSIASGTEQYYTIDIENLSYDEENDRYLVLIGTNYGENMINTLALTSLKVSGYEVASCEELIREDSGTEEVGTYNLLYQMKNYSLLMQPEEDSAVEVNENLVINSAKFSGTKVASGRTVTLTVVTTVGAENVEIYDEDGNAVNASVSAKKASGDKVTFTYKWTVTGSKGDELNYTVRALDANGALSVNEETVTITIR